MKKITVLSAVTVVSALLFAVPAFAQTSAGFTPSTVNVARGSEFSFVVSVDPNGTSNYAEKLVLKYPASQLEVVSFTQSPNWMAIPSQTGYDLIDNKSGVLIKTAGYANGISSKTDFGTVLFRAKDFGPATISVGTDSLAYEKNTQTAISGSDLVVTVKAPTPVVSNTPTGAVAEKTVATKLTVSEQPAAAVNAGVSVGTKTVYWVLGIAILLGGAWFGYKKSQENKDVTTK